MGIVRGRVDPNSCRSAILVDGRGDGCVRGLRARCLTLHASRNGVGYFGWQLVAVGPVPSPGGLRETGNQGQETISDFGCTSSLGPELGKGLRNLNGLLPRH